MNKQNSIIPENSPVFQTLRKSAISAKAVVFVGLPGVGKSLYINEFKNLAHSLDRRVRVVQWDVARKAFETPRIQERFPLGEGLVHNGVKLCAGIWLLMTIEDWLGKHPQSEDLLLIEAPLVGHRFIELAKIQKNKGLEPFFKSEAFQFICPIPSKKVREKIEAARAAQISEDAQVWTGAKPSVLRMLWKMTCGIANEFGRNIPMEGQPPYDPEIYAFVFGEILKHRRFIPLYVDEIFDIQVDDERELHNIGSLKATAETANRIAQTIMNHHPNDDTINQVVSQWYLT